LLVSISFLAHWQVLLALSLCKCNLLLGVGDHLIGLLLFLMIVVGFLASHSSSIKGSVDSNLDRCVVGNDRTDSMLGTCLRNLLCAHGTNSKGQNTQCTAKGHRA
jgi:hypothetical protein